MTNQKPWYKKWWAILLLFIFFLIIISVSTDDNKQDNRTNKSREVELNENIKNQTLNFEILNEQESETLFTDEIRYEIVGVTTETNKDELVKIAKNLKKQYHAHYDEYGDIQIYLFDSNNRDEAENYLRIPYEESIAKANYYNAITRLTLHRKKDNYSLLLLSDEDGNIIETIENF